MTDPAALPAFATAVRGYDRNQVEEYLAQLLGTVNEAEERARCAEAALAGSAAAQPAAPTSVDVGEHIARVLRAAEDSAAQLHNDAERHAQTGRAEAEQLVQRARQHAEHQADQVLAAAQDEAAQLVATAREEADQMHARTVALALERDRLVTEITALIDRVSAVLPAAATSTTAPAPERSAELSRGADGGGQVVVKPRGASRMLTVAP